MLNNISSTSRITGLASGLDTEGIVNNMLHASKAKIDKVKQQKVLLEWKQAYYKDIAAKLYDFQTKYFGTSKSSFSSSLSKLNATCNSLYVSVIPSIDSFQSNVYISDIVSLAGSAFVLSSGAVSSNPVISVSTDNLTELPGKSLVVTLDGTEKILTFSEKTYSTVADVESELASLFASAFGSGRVNLSLGGDSISLSAENSTLSVTIPDTVENNPTGILDFDGYASNRLYLTASLSSAGLSVSPVSNPDTDVAFTINGVSFSFANSESLAEIMSAINSSDAGVKISYSTLTDKFTLTSSETGSGSSVSIEDTSGSLMNSLFGLGVYKSGTDAVVKLSTDGSTDESDLITVTRSSNTFEVNGSTVKLLEKASGDAKEDIKISLAYDTDSIVDKVSSFVNAYNELLGSITKLTSEEIYSDYLPLTDDEKKELTDDEIELWTEKAKSGILRNDTYLKAITNELRSSIYTAVEGFGSLSSIGITSGSYSEKGKLYIDTDKLREALSKDVESALKYFTKESSTSYSLYSTAEQQETRFAENGVLSRILDVIKKNLNNIGKKGALIMLVGSPNSSYTSETEYSKRIKSIEDKIGYMEDKLSDEEERYWKLFTAMESALAKLNSQSSYIANMFGSN